MKKLLSSSSGFTLAEVVVAAGMLGVVSLGVMQLMTNMTKGQKKLEQDSNVSSIAIRADQVLRREHNCSATLRGKEVKNDWVDIDDIMRAKDSWKRNDADDVAGNKISAFSRDNVYGSAKDRVRLSNISYRAFYDTSSSNYATGTYNTTPESTYDFVGDTGATDITDEDRKRGAAVFRLEFERQVTSRGTDDEAQEQFAKRSFGTEKTYKYVQVEVITDGANIIQSCYSNNENFVESSCDSLDGTTENGDCKNLTVKNLLGGSTDPALIVEGNMRVIPDATDGDAGSLAIGGIPNEATDSNVDIAGSVAIGGVDPATKIGRSTGTPGDLSVFNSAAIGDVAPTSNSGDLSVQTSVGIGVAANSTAGDLLVNSSAAVGNGMAASSDGTLRVKTSIMVGPNSVASPADSGSIRANHSVAIGPGNATSATDGNLDVNRSASIGSGIDPTSNDGELTVKNGIIAGISGGSGTIQSIGTGGTVSIVNGTITTSLRYTNSAAANAVNANGFVTREWVNVAIGNTLKTSEAASTIANYINSVSSEGDTYASIKRAICDSITINGTQGMDSNCNVSNVGKISSSYDFNANKLTISQSNPSYTVTHSLKDCSQSGKCANVYSNNLVSGVNVTASNRVTGSKICIGSACRTTFTRKTCPSGHAVVALGQGGTIGCAKTY